MTIGARGHWVKSASSIAGRLPARPEILLENNALLEDRQSSARTAIGLRTTCVPSVQLSEPKRQAPGGDVRFRILTS
jgi:hypothetical protein